MQENIRLFFQFFQSVKKSICIAMSVHLPGGFCNHDETSKNHHCQNCQLYQSQQLVEKTGK